MTDLLIAPLLPLIRAQAEQADESRSVAADVINAIKGNPVMSMSASLELDGLASSVVAMGQELEATAAACGSTAWCLWNHLCVFHLFCGQLGRGGAEFLAGITKARQWVCFPGGAGTGVVATVDQNDVLLKGRAAFGSGARYADFAGVTFVYHGQKTPHFTVVGLQQPGVRVDATWKAMSLRASATDDVHYDAVRIPGARVVPFAAKYREVFRDPTYPHINARYAEDWVALSDLWLGCMAVGVAQAALDEACAGIRNRIAIAGVKMVERPTIHVNLGHAGALIDAARATVYGACAETDQRIFNHVLPTESAYLTQVSAAMMALKLCDEAMRLVLRVLGGNGLREGQSFERRYRDFQAMPLHINAHPDRVNEQYGRHLLGLPTENPF